MNNPYKWDPGQGINSSVNSIHFNTRCHVFNERYLYRLVIIITFLSMYFMFSQILYDYKGAVDDELTLVRGGIIEVLSDDPRVSGDTGWWTGKVDGKVK